MESTSHCVELCPGLDMSLPDSVWPVLCFEIEGTDTLEFIANRRRMIQVTHRHPGRRLCRRAEL